MLITSSSMSVFGRLFSIIVLIALASMPMAAATLALPPDTAPITLTPGQKVFPYRNPVYQGSFPDPAMLRVGDYFYAAATGERIIHSTDLTQWETVGTLFPAGKPAWAEPSSPEIWAPDLNYINGKYVAYFTARAGGYTDIHRGIGAAWADKPEGPYYPSEKPLAVGPSFRNIDPMAFLDDDGKRYLYWGSAKEPILVQELSADGLTLVGDAKIALTPDPNTRYARLVEGTWVIKRGGYYYILWSGDGYHPGNYAVSVARSTSPLGPFVRYADNPIIKENMWWTSPGHNSLIQDDAGQDWLVYHAYDTSDTELGRMLLIDKLIWSNGWPVVAKREPSSVLVYDGPVWKNSAVPTVEVASGKPCKASSEQDRKEAVKALDGNTYSGWLPTEVDSDAWLSIDLGQTQRITRVDLRFRRPASGDMRYLIETSRDGVVWQAFANRANAGSTYPWSERNEATGRYIRISHIVAPPGGNATLYDVKAFVYQNVWIDTPDLLAPVSGPLTVQAHIDSQLRTQSVTIKLDGQTVYAGATPPVQPLAAVDLADGAHQLTLQVIDANDAVWQHDLPFKVNNSQITSPPIGARWQGAVPISFTTGYSEELLSNTRVELIPLVYGERQNSAALVLHSGKTPPSELVLDTLTIADGAYELEYTVESSSGKASRSNIRLLVKNWDVLIDMFEPPVAQGWFGSVDRKKTAFETEGWSYDTNSADVFGGDSERRIWQGQGIGELIWSAPDLRRFTLVAYVRDIALAGLAASVSTDQEIWQPVQLSVTETQPLADGWYRVTVNGVVGDVRSGVATDRKSGAVGYMRLAVPQSLGATQLQLGRVELTATR